MDVAKCFNCSVDLVGKEGTEYYQISWQSFCGLQCFNIKFKESKLERPEESKPGRARKASKRKRSVKKGKRR